MRWLALCAFLLVSPALAQAPAPAAAPAVAPALAKLPEVEPSGFQASVQPERVTVGEPFIYELVITHPSEQRYELALPSDLGDFELLSQSRLPPQVGKEPAVTTFRLKMSAFNLGMLTLPDVPFLVSTPEGPKRFVAPGRTLEVGSTLPDDAQAKGEDLRDIQPPTEVAIRSWMLLWGLLGLLAAVLVGVVAYRLIQKYRNRPKAVVEPLKPLDVRTRQALDVLMSENLPSQGKVKDFYFRLSEIVRGYLGERYDFDALECTSSELMTKLRRKNPPGLPEDKLMRFISESDLVKYARAESSPEMCSESLTFGYELLEKTWPPPPPPEAAPVSHASGPRVS
ncbi:hypothetical protein [Vitiosangium sp. GDMCC 1.1324]|uniref:hypothetical protein n=1 Tax=Vitiosangium sp. (strain GDMCC 1.1324) TaxID=2138576 RepID=UPI000D3374DA|nr:hypothetical protein [Vitiosangium sp. GDMCC 1.1324]PTL78425.1 hypothetical protein DAT35_38475 [Vitiosangium sp. GDMCC 1.1324]